MVPFSLSRFIPFFPDQIALCREPTTITLVLTAATAKNNVENFYTRPIREMEEAWGTELKNHTVPPKSPARSPRDPESLDVIYNTGCCQKVLRLTVICVVKRTFPCGASIDQSQTK